MKISGEKRDVVAFNKTIGGLQSSQRFGYAKITLVIIAAVWFSVGDYGPLESLRS